MDKLATRIRIQQILKDLKMMYFNDYRYILKFSFTLTQDDIFFDCCTERLIKENFNTSYSHYYQDATWKRICNRFCTISIEGIWMWRPISIK